MLYLKTSSKPVAELTPVPKTFCCDFLAGDHRIQRNKCLCSPGFLRQPHIDGIGLHEQISLLLCPCYANFSATKLQFIMIVNLAPSWNSNCNIKEKKVLEAEKVAVCSSMVKKKKPHWMKLLIGLAVMYLYKTEM